MKKQGFVLLIVLAVLGVLAFLGITIAGRSQVSVRLSVAGLHQSHALLNARSAVELGASHLIHHIQTNLETAVSSTGETYEKVFDSLHSFATADVTDLSGALNVNDGIRAGRLEEASNSGFSYGSTVLDPWNVSSGQENISGRINLRIRRLLNAYGDAHRFMATHGLPEWLLTNFSGSENNYQSDFFLTSTAYEDRFQSMPPRDMNGNVVSAMQSRALGDRIIGSRPRNGFQTVDALRGIVDAWADEFIPNANEYTGGRSFFEYIKNDLTVSLQEDETLLRMKKEFGTFHHTIDGTVPLSQMMVLDDNPPDLSNLFAPHSASLVNLNTASMAVRAAVFYAPTNVGYICEGLDIGTLHQDRDNTGNSLEYYGKSNQITYLASQLSGSVGQTLFYLNRPTLGVSGPSFRPENLKENGILGVEGTTTQKNHLMSLRDALVLAQGYEAYTKTPYNFSSLKCFDDFSSWLTWMNTEAVLPERAPESIPTTGPFKNEGFGRYYGSYFANNYIAKTLPHIFSGVRRFPGWLHAPASLLSAYQQTAMAHLGSAFQHEDQVLRSIEDFVYSHHHPKVSFVSNGFFRIRGRGQYLGAPGPVVRSIRIEMDVFDEVVLRSQADFIAYNDSSMTETSIDIGPEPNGVAPSQHLGLIGVKDQMGDPLAGSQPQPLYSCTLPFDESLLPISPALGQAAFDPHGQDLLDVPPAGVVNYYPHFNLPWSNTLMDDLNLLRTEPTIPGQTFRRPRSALDVWNVSLRGLDHATEAEALDYIKTMLEDAPGYPGDGQPLDRYLWWLSTMDPLIIPLHKYPEPFDTVHAGKTYDQLAKSSSPDPNFFQALRTNTSTDRRWQVPRPDNEILSDLFEAAYPLVSNITPQVPPPPPAPADAAALDAYMANPWVSRYFGGLWPGPGQPLDTYSSLICSVWFGVNTWANYWWSGDWNLEGEEFLLPVEYPSDWANGPGLISQSIEASKLEGETSSLFEPGSLGSDLSPFGGISLGGRGHGNKSDFTDSLYFEPEKLISASEATGDFFNKVFLSLWYRVPSGYLFRYDMKTLFHATFWEHVELEPFGEWQSAASPPSEPPENLQKVYRPICFNLTTYTNWSANPSSSYPWIFFTHSQATMHTDTGYQPGQNMGTGEGGIYFDFMPPYKGASFPFIAHPDVASTTPENFMGLGMSNNPLSYRHLFRQDQIPYPASGAVAQSIPRQANGVFLRGLNDHRSGTPGVWQRVIVGWDTSVQTLTLGDRIWLDMPTGQNDANNPTRNRDSEISGLDRMVMSFGETPLFRHQGLEEQFAPGSSWVFDETDIDNPNGSTFPFKRLNSLIDNIDLRIGYPTGTPAGGPFSGSVNVKQIDDDFPSNMTYRNFRTKRYPISTENEPEYGTPTQQSPKWFVNPQFRQGDKLLSFGARIYDVPDFGTNYNSPKVGLSAQSSSIPVHTPIGTSTGGNFVSPETYLYAGDAVDSSTRFVVQYMTVDPSGAPLKDRLADIPYLKEISWRFIPKEGAKYLSFQIE